MKESNLEPYDRTTNLIFFWLQGLHFLKLGLTQKISLWQFQGTRKAKCPSSYLRFDVYEVFDNQPMQGTGWHTQIELLYETKEQLRQAQCKTEVLN